MNGPRIDLAMAPRTRRFMRELMGTDVPAGDGGAENWQARHDALRQLAAQASLAVVVIPLLILAFVGIMWLQLGSQIAP